MARLALYGNVGIVRVFCNDCQQTALVLNGVRQCCDFPVDEETRGVERIIEPENIRRQPSPAEKRKILRRQDDKCLYCDRRFGSSVWYKGQPRVLRVHWDHVLPFEYSRDNSLGNFVAACHICNHWKADFVFTCLEEIQVYVAEKWERVSTDVAKAMPSMRDAVYE